MGGIPKCQAPYWDISLLPPALALSDIGGVKKAASLPPDASPIAREIYRRMVAAGLGQKALATKAELNETYVRDIFRGKSNNPKHEHLGKIAKALGCTLLDLSDPGRPDNFEDGERAAQTDEEIALLKVWRRASDVGRDRIMGAIEDALVGELLGRGKAKDV